MITKIKKTIITLAFIFIPFFVISGVLMPPTVHAAGTPPGATNKCGSGITFFPSWYDGICDPTTGGVQSPNKMKGGDTAGKLSRWITVIALNIVTMLLFAVGYVSLGFTIYGGFKYMISGDTASGTTAARKTITNAVIGLVISIMAVAIVKLVTGAIVQ